MSAIEMCPDKPGAAKWNRIPIPFSSSPVADPSDLDGHDLHCIGKNKLGGKGTALAKGRSTGGGFSNWVHGHIHKARLPRVPPIPWELDGPRKKNYDVTFLEDYPI